MILQHTGHNIETTAIVRMYPQQSVKEKSKAKWTYVAFPPVQALWFDAGEAFNKHSFRL